MPALQPGTADWHAQVQEPTVNPSRRIVDPHHHLWRRPTGDYLLDDLWGDTEAEGSDGQSHNIEETVFVECRACYREGGPEHLRCVGETEFVAEAAAASAEGDGATIAGIVSHANLTLGEGVTEVLDAHEEAGNGLFRGIRHAGARDPHPEALRIAGRAPEGLYSRDDYRRGMKLLGDRGLTFDTWHYHHQNRDFAELARAVPETTMILDHFGTPLGVGPYADRREEIFAAWKDDIAEIAELPNVVAKIGGLAMPDNGFGWSERATPATSEELVAAHARYYHHTIECFGPDRCMFESNFPVDKLSIGYHPLYNALKRIASSYSEDEQDAMFYRTAARVYRL